MATRVLARDESFGPNNETCTWQVDYDDVGHTIGHTAVGQATLLTLTVTVVATQATFTRDITADLNKGRIVDFSGVPPSMIPAAVKGVPYPVVFASSWTP